MRWITILAVMVFGACSGNNGGSDASPFDSCPGCEGLRFPDGVAPEGGFVDGSPDGSADSYVDPNDWDGDGLSNDVEQQLGLNPNNKDTDNDGQEDGQEVGDPQSPTDSDGDGKIDAKEPSDFDSDLDGTMDSQDKDDTDGKCGNVQRLFILATLSLDTTLAASCSPYKVLGSLTVNDGATLTVAADVTVQFGPAATLFVGDNATTGGLTLAGQKNLTTVHPVILTADTTQPKKSFWRGVVLENGKGLTLSHATVQYGGGPTGGGDPRALLLVKSANSISLNNSTLQHGHGHGLHATLKNGGGKLFLGFKNNNFGDLDHAAALNIKHLGEIESGNNFGVEGSGGEVNVSEGTVDQDATWQEIGVPYVFSEASITVDANLALQAGVKLIVPANAAVYVGYNSGKLVVSGTASSPVIFTSQPNAAGTWQGIMLQGGNNNLQHLRVIGAGKNSSVPMEAALYIGVYAGVSVKDIVTSNSSGYGVYYYRAGDECSQVPTAEFGFTGTIAQCGLFCVDDNNNPGACLKQAP